MKKITLICFLLSIVLCINAAYGQDEPVLIVFHSVTCHKCIEAKQNVLPTVEKEFKGLVRFEYRDIADINNYTLFLSLKQAHKVKIQLSLPVFYMKGEFLTQDIDLRRQLRSFILNGLQRQQQLQPGSQVDLKDIFKHFSWMGVTIAGLEDGINPCAFTVIIFFISFLALQGYRRRELTVIGIFFIVAVFATYLLIGIGIFNFLYSLKEFWFLTKIVNFVIGAVTIALGFLAFFDFLKFKRTNDTETQTLQLPKAIKDRIHALIGLYYRKDRKTTKNKPPSMVKLITTAILTGFLVTLLEAVCTGQLYLPTISFILKNTPLKLQAFAYLVYYNLLFIMPLCVILFLALLGVTSAQFYGVIILCFRRIFNL
ncbi:MAG: hypothetical protein NTW13_03225 [Candidatus Omnitrophica bacterium]|nr:hypothetical protein [Candidatus Omnitrophota bacterium]